MHGCGRCLGVSHPNLLYCFTGWEDLHTRYLNYEGLLQGAGFVSFHLAPTYTSPPVTAFHLRAPLLASRA